MEYGFVEGFNKDLDWISSGYLSIDKGLELLMANAYLSNDVEKLLCLIILLKRNEDIKMEVIYQIYPLSFLDTNGDGIGDINGVIKNSILKRIRVSYIWLTPIFKSPMKDNGYDISDYYQINEMFGSKDDLINLINKAKT